MNNKGQALVEFVLVLPIFLFIALGIVDFGNILNQKYKLENDLDFIVELKELDKVSEITKFINDNKLEISYGIDGEFTTISLRKNIKITTPGLNLILDDPYYVKVERHVYEQ